MRIYTWFILLHIIFVVNHAIGQLGIDAGISLMKPDDRFEFLEDVFNPEVQDFIINGKPNLNKAYFLIVSRPYQLNKNLILEPGIGVNSFRSTQVMLIKNTEFFKSRVDVGYWNNRDFRNSLIFSQRLLYRYYSKTKTNFSMGVSVNYLLDFHRRIYFTYNRPSFGYLEIWSLQSNSLALMLSHAICLKKTRFNLDFRIVNLKFQDKALYNNGRQREFFNPTMGRISIGRIIGE